MNTPNATVDIRRVIARTTAELLAAVNASDADRCSAVWADDGVLMPPHHPTVQGHEAIVNKMCPLTGDPIHPKTGRRPNKRFEAVGGLCDHGPPAAETRTLGRQSHHARMNVYHVSEEPAIGVFEPRQVETSGESLVWAIDDEHLRNYLTPRECPRVTFYAGPRTTVADRERFLGSSSAVVAIESGWFERMRSCRLFCYHLPGETFECSDRTAGYFVSRTAVRPTRVDVIQDPVLAILHRGVELRVLPDLWSLRDAVIESTLEFSIIRWRNAGAG